MATMAIEHENGTPVELASYHCDVGPRRIVGQRVDGAVRLTDVPTGGSGRAYLIEPKLERKAALEALISDYLAMAKRLGYVPMQGWF